MSHSPLPPSPTRVQQAMDTVRQRIAQRQLTPGARLPSIRLFASSLGISKSTVVEAYDRLVAEGAIRSRPGSGFYVAGHLAPLTLSEIGPRLDREIDPLWVSRQSLETSPLALKPGCGWLPASWLPEESLRRALRTAARMRPSLLTDYASTLGLVGLRRHLAQRLQERSTDGQPDQILITDSGTHAIDLLCRFLIEPGDTVLVDDPCYFNFIALLRAHRARIISVPYTPKGPDLTAFAQALTTHRPRLYITNSGLHNPTGGTLSPIVAHRLLKLAQDHDLTIIEDDIFGDFEPSAPARLASFDGLDRVVQIGSFSKSLSASVRCGYIAARPDWIEALADLRTATSFSGSSLSQELLLTLLRDSTYRKHIDALHQRLGEARYRTIEWLRRLGIKPWLIPQGGMFLWCVLPDGLDSTEIARWALPRGMVLAPGNVFSLSQSARPMMRFNVSQMSDPQLPDRLAQAMEHGRYNDTANG